MRRPALKLLLLTLCLLAADQLSKIVVNQRLKLGDSVPLLPFFRLQLVQNQGIAFGMMNQRSALIIAVSGTIVLVMIIAAFVMRNDRRLLWPMAFLVAGSAGNLVDRVINGSVTDFLQVPHWPAFNLADSYIVFGVGLLILQLLIWPKPSNERGHLGPSSAERGHLESSSGNERENAGPPENNMPVNIGSTAGNKRQNVASPERNFDKK